MSRLYKAPFFERLLQKFKRMKRTGNPPKTKRPNRPAGSEKTDDRAPQDVDNKETASEANRAESDSGKPSREEVISTWRKPITNQDEQEKITDDGGSDIPVQDS